MGLKSQRPLSVLFLSLLISGLYSAAPGTSDTLQISTDSYSLPHRPWEMNSFSWEEIPNLAISSAHRVGIFFPFPLPMIVTSTVSHLLRCDKSILTSPGRHLSPAPIPAALHSSIKICLNPSVSFFMGQNHIRMPLASEKVAFP